MLPRRFYDRRRQHCARPRVTTLVVTTTSAELPEAYTTDVLWPNRVAWARENGEACVQIDLPSQNSTHATRALERVGWSSMRPYDFMRWTKFFVLLELHRESSLVDCTYSWMHWLDADALFSSYAPTSTLLHGLSTSVVFERGRTCEEPEPPPPRTALPASAGRESIPFASGTLPFVNSGSFFVRRSDEGRRWLDSVLEQPFGAAARAAPNNMIQDNLAVILWAAQATGAAAASTWYSPRTVNAELKNWREGDLVLHIFGADAWIRKYEMLTQLAAVCRFPGAPAGAGQATGGGGGGAVVHDGLHATVSAGGGGGACRRAVQAHTAAVQHVTRRTMGTDYVCRTGVISS